MSQSAEICIPGTKLAREITEFVKHKPDTTFDNVKADVMADQVPNFKRGNFSVSSATQLGQDKWKLGVRTDRKRRPQRVEMKSSPMAPDF